MVFCDVARPGDTLSITILICLLGMQRLGEEALIQVHGSVIPSGAMVDAADVPGLPQRPPRDSALESAGRPRGAAGSGDQQGASHSHRRPRLRYLSRSLQ